MWKRRQESRSDEAHLRCGRSTCLAILRRWPFRPREYKLAAVPPRAAQHTRGNSAASPWVAAAASRPACGTRRRSPTPDLSTGGWLSPPQTRCVLRGSCHRCCPSRHTPQGQAHQ
eukprot:scaffold15750_cov110-Isochrysis_galbana.AAC.3